MNTTETDCKDVLQDFEPVRFRFDSSQRKNHVLIYDSRRHPGKCSEWYFVRRNQSNQNETYRCVHCRGAHEKARRQFLAQGFTNPITTNPGARIIVQDNHFVVNPDYPLGDHICNFEKNENCDTHVVWSRRALLRANSELRLHPEKPKLKFQKLLQSIEEGNDEYEHLSVETRKLIVEQLTAKNGFDSRRRSFARNNSFAMKRLREAGEHSNVLYALSEQGSHKAPNCKGSPVKLFVDCGMPFCELKFDSESKRNEHRNEKHPQMFFIDSYDQLEDYRRLVNQVGGNGIDEVILTENGDVVEIGKTGRANSTRFDFRVAEYADHSALNNVEYEVECSSSEPLMPTLMMPKKETIGTPSPNSPLKVSLDPPAFESPNADEFLNRIDCMLNQVRDYASLVARHPIRRERLEKRVSTALNAIRGAHSPEAVLQPFSYCEFEDSLFRPPQHKRCKPKILFSSRGENVEANSSKSSGEEQSLSLNSSEEVNFHDIHHDECVEEEIVEDSFGIRDDPHDYFALPHNDFSNVSGLLSA